MQQDHPLPEQQPKRIQRLIFGVVTTLFLGAIGSGIWEVLFRPGLSSIGLWLASASTWFENEIYSSAALDPQPLPGLVGLLLICTAPMIAAGWFLHKGFIETRLRQRLSHDFDKVKATARDSAELRRILRVRLRILASAGFLLCAMLAAFFFVGFTLQNEATKVWRISQANFDIAAACTTEQEIRDIRAEFRLMQSKMEFRKLRDRLNTLAAQKGFQLQWYDL